MISVLEIIDMLAMTFIVGYIFMDVFRRPMAMHEDPLAYTRHRFDYRRFWFAAAATAPAIILHELAHKFVAISLGMNATFHAAYGWLLFGLLLKLLNFGFIFFVPAFVSISGSSTQLGFAMTALAGPLLNALLWLSAHLLLKSKVKLSKQNLQLVFLTKQINMFLFIFNMLPIPGFDGFQFFGALLGIF